MALSQRGSCIRDQERAPIEISSSPCGNNRASCDWHLLGCQVQPGASVYVNKVGTFGVAAALHCWSRVASALGRLAQYVAGETARTWHMLHHQLEAGGSSSRSALVVLLLSLVPLATSLVFTYAERGDSPFPCVIL